MTATELLAAVASCSPAVEAGELVFNTDPSEDLEPAFCVLHTGLRALLTGRTWYGSTCADSSRVMVIELNPGKPIPPRIALLCVAGDERWDRFHPEARIDLLELFAN